VRHSISASENIQIYIPSLNIGASDSVYTRAAGIPTYGLCSIFYDLDDSAPEIDLGSVAGVASKKLHSIKCPRAATGSLSADSVDLKQLQNSIAPRMAAPGQASSFT
jgi:hypothetical protein